MATRCNKLAANFLSAVILAEIRLLVLTERRP